MRNTTKLKEIPEEDDFANSEKSSEEDLTRSNPNSEGTGKFVRKST